MSFQWENKYNKNKCNTGEFQGILLIEIRQTCETTDYMVPFLWNWIHMPLWTHQKYRNKNHVNGYKSAGWESLTTNNHRGNCD